MRLQEILAEALAEGDKALCFTQFAEFGHILRNHLQERLGREVLFLHGGTSKPARDEMVSRFQADGGPPLFLLSLKAGGTGLNLTAANHVVHFDRWWNPAVEDQATDRAFRIGQRKNVQVRKLTCVGTLEERIDTLIAQKRGARGTDRRQRRAVDHRTRHGAAARARVAFQRGGPGSVNEFSDWRDWEPSRPLPVDGGIAARSKRGPIGETWWSQRFIALLDSFGVGSRLARGRNYARRGQVVELEIEPGVVLAKVQGSRYTPYRVRIRAKTLTEHQWRRVEKAMATRALPLAKLLAGEMPHDIEDVFHSCKLTLFPRSNAELKASCTCPDWENPCKHVAAVYYILAERFDEDPFLIFAWRGRDRDELVQSLRARRGAGGGPRSQAARSATAEPQPAPLAERLDSFWRSGPRLADLQISPLAGEVPDTVLRQLGPAPAQLAEHNVIDVLAPAYATLAEKAQRRALE